MPETINWSAVVQSVNDTWLPILSIIIVIIALIIITKIFQNKKK